MVKTALIHPKFARRIPDPSEAGRERFVFLVPASTIPELPLDPNPRDQNIDLGVYREVQKSLRNVDCAPDTFHLKNKGITVIAASVRKADQKGFRYELEFDDGQGIVDGGHTYAVIRDALNNEEVPEQQFVKVEVLVGVDAALAVDIASGLNTAVAVSEMSIQNLRDRFDPIKEALVGEPYESVIAYKENEQDKVLDVRDVIAFMSLFNIGLFPNEGSEYPTYAYHRRATSLRSFINNGESFQKMMAMLPEILVLSDTISYEARGLHNDAGGHGGRLAFVEQRFRGDFKFPFIDKNSKYKLAKGALIPMLGAFRWMVVETNGQYEWRGTFDDVLTLWRASGAELMRLTKATSDELGKVPDAVGKSRNHWATVHSVVVKNQLLAQAG